MPDKTEHTQTRSPRKAISFRTGNTITTKVKAIAAEQNLDPSDIYRQAFNAGLEQLYGLKIVGNEIVDSSAVASRWASIASSIT